MDVVLHRAQRLCRLSPPLGAGVGNFSTGVFANRSNNVKGRKEKDTALAYVSQDIVLYVKVSKFIMFRFPMKTRYRKIVNLLC